MFNHIIGHRSDPDGILAHTILRRYLLRRNNKEKNECVHYFADYGDMTDSFEEVKSKEGGNVIVADLSFNKEMEKNGLLEKINLNHHSFAWFDHHQPSIDARNLLEKYCDPVILATNKCAAELINLYYNAENSKDKYADFLAHLGQVHDFERKDDTFADLAYNLQEIISSGHDLNQLVIDLAEEKVFSGESFLGPYNLLLDKFKLKKQEAYGKLVDTIEYRSIADNSFVFALSEPLLYMKLATAYIKDEIGSKNFVMMYEGKPNVILRASGKIGKKIPIFCQTLGGGGRGHGGGFVLDHDVNKETYQQDAFYVEEKLKNFLLN